MPAHRPNPSAVEAILATVRRIPAGGWRPDGQVAAVAGLPRRARLVARVLATLPEGRMVPWRR
jgi:methylated-DNA-protein-cysteine methyltransferase-like protein